LSGSSPATSLTAATIGGVQAPYRHPPLILIAAPTTRGLAEVTGPGDHEFRSGPALSIPVDIGLANFPR